jgi:hypothetical protein
VTTADGNQHDVSGDYWPDECMVVGNTYDRENCLWFDDIVFMLHDLVPGNEEFESVEVLA